MSYIFWNNPQTYICSFEVFGLGPKGGNDFLDETLRKRDGRLGAICLRLGVCMRTLLDLCSEIIEQPNRLVKEPNTRWERPRPLKNTNHVLRTNIHVPLS